MKNTSLAFSSVIWEVSCSSLRFPLGVSVKRCRGFQTSKTQSVDKSAGIFDGNSAFFHLSPPQTRWVREPKSKTVRRACFFFILWCGQLRSARNRRKIFTENIVRTDGIRGHNSPQHAVSANVSYVYILLVAISANVINSIPSFGSLFIPGFSFSLLRRRGSEDEAWTDRTPCEIETKRRRELTKRAWKRRYEDDRWWMIREWSWTMRHDERKMGKDFSVQKLLCVKTTVCKRVCAYKFLCVKVPLCKGFFVKKLLCVKASVCKSCLRKSFCM